MFNATAYGVYLVNRTLNFSERGKIINLES